MLAAAGAVIKDPPAVFFGAAMKLDRHGVPFSAPEFFSMRRVVPSLTS